MKEADVKKYLGKMIKLFLKNNFVFNGKIVDLNENTLEMLDKYNSVVTIDLSEISLINEQRKCENGK